jgi:RHS repeat-associated protein
VPSLYDFTFREHSMSQGRWIRTDPAGFAAASLTNPQTWNRYAYVGNTPLNFIDPTGLQSQRYCWLTNHGNTGGCVGGQGSGDPDGDPLALAEAAFNAQVALNQALNNCLTPGAPCVLPLPVACANSNGNYVSCNSSNATMMYVYGGCVTASAVGGGTETDCSGGTWMSFQDFANSALATMMAVQALQATGNSWQNPNYEGQQLTPNAMAILSMVNSYFPAWLTSPAVFSSQTCLSLVYATGVQAGATLANLENPPVAGGLAFTTAGTAIVTGAGCP